MSRSLALQRHSRGVALAIVLWFVAGMSLLVSGIVFTARTDTRLAQIHLERAHATAAGDGGITLLLADLVEGGFTAAEQMTLPRGTYQVGGYQVAVVALPAQWLVDVNAAEQPLLLEAMQRSGAASGSGAAALAEAVVQWRAGYTGATARPFEALEDLLAVEGMNRSSFENLRDYLVDPGAGAGAGLRESGGRANSYISLNAALSPGMRLTTPALLGPASGRYEFPADGFSSFRVDAILVSGQRNWLRRRWVRLGGSSGLPWTVQRSEPARIVPVPRRQG